MLKTKLLVGVCLYTMMVHAQKEQNNWYFGRYAALNFETGVAKPTFDNPQHIYGKTASISDPVTGKLLFYTSGQQVWNHKHQLMVNGNIPSASPTGDMIIVAMPESTSKYYLFFIGNIADLQYVIIDMSKNGGEGEVITTAKTISSRNVKQVTAIRHQYADACWIITHEINNNHFKAHYVDVSGVSAQPIVTAVGAIASSYGDMAGSNKGNKLVVTHYTNNYKTEVFDFDQICGVFSNPVELTITPTWENPYGIAFSPDDSKLYITYSVGESFLVQYHGANFGNSSVIAYSAQNFNIIRLGPDGRIYIATHDNGIPGNRIDAILNPNELATSCNYQKTFLKLNEAGEIKRAAQFELPAFITGLSKKNLLRDSLIQVGGLCKGDTTLFSFNTKYTFDSLTWNFGDNSTPKTSVFPFQKHFFKQAKTYSIKLIIHKCGMSFTLNDSITIKEVPPFSLGNDTTLCSGGSIILVGPIGEKFLWSTGDSSSAITVNKPGKYSLKVSNGNCSGVDEMNISYHPPLFIALGDEYTVCDKDKELIKLDAGEGFSAYKWTPTEDTTQWIIVGEVKDYFVVVKDFRGCDGNDGTTVKRRCPVTLYFPNSFSPNDDGINDFYVPVGVDVESFHLKIYNRWGQLVFESNNINDVWNGTLNNKPAPNDTYIYVAEYAGYLNKKLKAFNVEGNITLMR
jgi:gliding motility-associated-like protein